MVIAWDVDGTLFSYEKDGFPPPPSRREVRPHAHDVLDFLEYLGVENHIWSRAGKPNAREAAEILGIPPDRCHAKTKFPEELETPFKPDLVIDDNPDESVLIFPHILVTTYKGDEEDRELLDILPEIRKHYEAVVPDEGESLSEIRVRWRRKRRIPLRIKMRRRRYYRRRRTYQKRYRRKWLRRPRTKRLMRIRKRLVKRYGRKLRRYRMRITV